ncbi:Rhodanese-like domain-containing protein 4, chloroplastic [Ancistrocladus abbreviatus]
MEALNALGLKPICGLPGKRRKPRKLFTIPAISPFKLSTRVQIDVKPSNFSEAFSRTFQNSLVLLSSALGANKLANALTYEEALRQSVNTEAAGDFDARSVVDSIVNFGAENPVVIAGGFAVLAVPLILSQVLGKAKPYGVESAKNAYAKLADDADAQLLDIRSPKEFREVGSPDIRGLRKKPVSIVYKSEDKPGFLRRLSLRFREPENTTLFILDKFDGSSKLVAELVTANGFKAAYAIKDGAEGARGWMNSGLPWILPKKTFSVDFSNLTESLGGALPEASDALPVTLGLAAATGLGLVAFTEVETILELLGSAVLVQLISKKLLFAEDRKQTLKQVDEFLNTKIAPKELVSEIKQIGAALLSSPVGSKALPAPVQASSETAVTDETVQNAEVITEVNAQPQVEAPGESTPEINSVPKSIQTGLPRPLSPYPSVTQDQED